MDPVDGAWVATASSEIKVLSSLSLIPTHLVIEYATVLLRTTFA